MASKKHPIELRKVNQDSNPKLKRLLAEISDAESAPSTKPVFGPRFNASGKSKRPIVSD